MELGYDEIEVQVGCVRDKGTYQLMINTDNAAQCLNRIMALEGKFTLNETLSKVAGDAIETNMLEPISISKTREERAADILGKAIVDRINQLLSELTAH